MTQQAIADAFWSFLALIAWSFLALIALEFWIEHKEKMPEIEYTYQYVSGECRKCLLGNCCSKIIRTEKKDEQISDDGHGESITR